MANITGFALIPVAINSAGAATDQPDIDTAVALVGTTGRAVWAMRTYYDNNSVATQGGWRHTDFATAANAFAALSGQPVPTYSASGASYTIPVTPPADPAPTTPASP